MRLGMSVVLVAELDTAAARLLLYLDWWVQLTATRLRLVTPMYELGMSVELVAELDTSAGRLFSTWTGGPSSQPLASG
jgi:hypothetical protein